jgi:hypothetical protein
MKIPLIDGHTGDRSHLEHERAALPCWARFTAGMIAG